MGLLHNNKGEERRREGAGVMVSGRETERGGERRRRDKYEKSSLEGILLPSGNRESSWPAWEPNKAACGLASDPC